MDIFISKPHDITASKSRTITSQLYTYQPVNVVDICQVWIPCKPSRPVLYWPGNTQNAPRALCDTEMRFGKRSF